MFNSMLLASFWESYGIWIVLVGLFGLMFVYNIFKTKRYNEQYEDFVLKIVPGTKVKTQSGFYGTVEKVTDTTDGKVVTLKISENAFIDVFSIPFFFQKVNCFRNFFHIFAISNWQFAKKVLQ